MENNEQSIMSYQHVMEKILLAEQLVPLFDELREQYDLYHMVLTVPNVSGEDLRVTVVKMFFSCCKLFKYFSGNSKIKSVDFEQYGYAGAFSSLEVVVNSTDYHPHLHCIVLLKKDLSLCKDLCNRFSFCQGKFVKTFSDLEVLIQKIWCLLMNGNKVNLENLSFVSDAYICVLDKVEGDEWVDFLRPVIKLSYDQSSFLSYSQFKTLYKAFRNQPLMRRYGLLYGIFPDIFRYPLLKF